MEVSEKSTKAEILRAYEALLNNVKIRRQKEQDEYDSRKLHLEKELTDKKAKGLLRYKLTACVIARNEAIQAIYLIWIASSFLLAMTGFANFVILIHNNS